MKARSLAGAIVACLLAVGCGKSTRSNDAALEHPENVVQAGNPMLSTSIGDESKRFSVLGKQKAVSSAVKESGAAVAKASRALLESVARTHPEATRAPASDAPASSLVLGFPVGLLDQQYVFGGVITKVSDTENQSLGDLKLTDLPPISVTASVVRAEDGYAFVLVGCASKCEEGADQHVLLAMPVLGADADKKEVQLDLSTLGKELNLIEILDPDGSDLKLKTKSSVVTSFDYSLNTLVFDVEVTMVPLTDSAARAAVLGGAGALAADAAEAAGAKETKFTVRWYLKLASAFTPGFTAREATNGVGFFMTERAKLNHIERQPLPYSIDSGLGTNTVHYYLKNVPTERRAAFAASFDNWNAEFKKILGKDLLDYEFIEKDDPRYDRLVTGDARFHIVEWDLVNKASYGGLGPSMASQATGEIFSSNVLIQGPTIMGLYTKWYGVAAQADALAAAGREGEARALLAEGARELARAADHDEATIQFKLNLSNRLDFRITSRMPGYRDPRFQRDDFEIAPPNVAFADYMTGYFKDMLTHELGHNLGLRHNFRGNLGAKDGLVQDGVSDSVMEYLGRKFRYLDGVGEYDRMALSYGYQGKAPAVTNAFCTDEDAGSATKPANSAECSSDDATNDPFSYLEGQLQHAISYLTLGTSADAPVWTVPDMEKELKVAFTGLGLYASSAEATSKSWTNFFGKGDRPSAVADVKGYVLKRLKLQLCGADLDAAVAAKGTAEAKQKTLANVAALRQKAVDLLGSLKAYTATELACQ